MSGKADDEAILAYGKEENAVRRKKDRKDVRVLNWNEYKVSLGGFGYFARAK